MKVINICETPLLASEVYSLIRAHPRNALAFDARDPLENPDITDADELRRLVAARRATGFLENSLSIEEIDQNRLPKVLSALRSCGLSKDQICRLVDAAVITGAADQSGLIYVSKVLGDAAANFSEAQLAQMRVALQVLTGKADESVIEQSCSAVEEGPASKRRVSSRRR